MSRPPAPQPAPRPGGGAAGGPVRDKATVRWWQIEVTRSVKLDEVMNFSRQSAAFLEAGISILDALAVIAEDGASKKMAAVLLDVRRMIREGSSLGNAIAQYSEVFPGYYIAMVRSAELTGKLDEVFEQLGSYLERDISARQQVRSAMTYPTVVLGIAAVAVTILSVYVLPKFASLYGDLGADLPLATRILIGFTDFIQDFWFLIIAAFVLLSLIATGAFGGSWGKARRDKLLLRLPALGKLFHLIAVERFCRVLAALTTAGVSLPDAVQVSSDATNNRVYQEKLSEAREAMVRGEGLARPIAATGLFPAAARQMIRVGEQSGHLDQQLTGAAKFYERELRYRLERVTDLIEPIVLVTVGLVVGFIAVAQVSAMYSIFNQVR